MQLKKRKILCCSGSIDFPRTLVIIIFFQKLHFIIISKKSIHQVLDYWDVSIIGSHIVHDYTLLPYGICCLLQPKYTKIRTNTLLPIYLCWQFYAMVIHIPPCEFLLYILFCIIFSDGSGSDFPGIGQVGYSIFSNFRVASGSGISKNL